MIRQERVLAFFVFRQNLLIQRPALAVRTVYYWATRKNPVNALVTHAFVRVTKWLLFLELAVLAWRGIYSLFGNADAVWPLTGWTMDRDSLNILSSMPAWRIIYNHAQWTIVLWAATRNMFEIAPVQGVLDFLEGKARRLLILATVLLAGWVPFADWASSDVSTTAWSDLGFGPQGASSPREVGSALLGSMLGLTPPSAVVQEWSQVLVVSVALWLSVSIISSCLKLLLEGKERKPYVVAVVWGGLREAQFHYPRTFYNITRVRGPNIQGLMEEEEQRVDSTSRPLLVDTRLGWRWPVEWRRNGVVVRSDLPTGRPMDAYRNIMGILSAHMNRETGGVVQEMTLLTNFYTKEQDDHAYHVLVTFTDGETFFESEEQLQLPSTWRNRHEANRGAADAVTTKEVSGNG